MPNDSPQVPLAERLRPKTFDEIIGHEAVLGSAKPLRVMYETGHVRSLILWGPPGSGKTTIARLLAQKTQSHFVEFSAVSSGVTDIRRVVEETKIRLEQSGQATILFIDEIHRFTKAQQDAFLPHVEAGTIILIGATTENPGFEVIGPLISRSHIYRLEALSEQNMAELFKRAKAIFPNLQWEKDAEQFLIQMSNGDARTLLNALELAAQLAGPKSTVHLAIAEQAIQRKALLYDKKGDSHYDTISAFIKSLRGSDPNAALYWLARMLEGGEDPMFIARRMVIFASEDIGNAQPTALVVATSAMQATHLVGLPEAQLILAQAATYLATANKNRGVARGISAAKADVINQRLEPVPLHLRNAANSVMKTMGAGRGYRWPKKDGEQPTDLGYLPPNLKGRRYYDPPQR